jgi:L-threonylcarbamoyladenylate synthase
VVLVCGALTDSALIAQKLYYVLREFNEYDLDVIYSENFNDIGLGKAIMNRLIKASNHRIIKQSDK